MPARGVNVASRLGASGARLLTQEWWVTSLGTRRAEISSGFEWCHPKSYTQGAKDIELRAEDHNKLPKTWQQQRDRALWKQRSLGPEVRISLCGNDLTQGVTRALGWEWRNSIIARTRVGTADGREYHGWSTASLINSMGFVVAGLGGVARTASVMADRSSQTKKEEPTVALVLCWC